MVDNNQETTSRWSKEQLEVLAKMGIDAQSADNIVEDLPGTRKQRRLQKGICICGHGANRHKRNAQGQVICQVNIRYCHCHKFRGVITASTLNPFARVSDGNANQHALIRGIVALMESGGTFNWIDGAYICASCGVTDAVYPVIIDGEGRPAEPNKDILFDRYDILLCQQCDVALQTTGRLPNHE